MTDHDLDSFEQELSKLTPASPPSSLARRLSIEPRRPVAQRAQKRVSGETTSSVPAWLAWVRLLAPAGVVVVLAVFLWIQIDDDIEVTPPATTANSWMPEEIEVDRHLMVAFEGIARLPDGMPFRFRYYGWDEELVARDASGTVELRQRQPRAEIVPVTMAVY
jgi:hypothetical protein